MHERRTPKSSIEVGNSEFLPAGPNCVIETFGLVACIGVALYDLASKRGAIGHFDVEAGDRKIILGQIKPFVDSLTNPNLVAYVRGGVRMPGDTEDHFVRPFRQNVLDVLHEVGISDDTLDFEWLNNPDQVVDIALDTSTGEFRCLVSDTDDTDLDDLD